MSAAKETMDGASALIGEEEEQIDETNNKGDGLISNSVPGPTRSVHRERPDGRTQRRNWVFFFCCVVAVVVVVVVLVIRYGTAKEESDRNTATSGNGPSRRRNGSRPAASL